MPDILQTRPRSSSSSTQRLGPFPFVNARNGALATHVTIPDGQPDETCIIPPHTLSLPPSIVPRTPPPSPSDPKLHATAEQDLVMPFILTDSDDTGEETSTTPTLDTGKLLAQVQQLSHDFDSKLDHSEKTLRNYTDQETGQQAKLFSARFKDVRKFVEDRVSDVRAEISSIDEGHEYTLMGLEAKVAALYAKLDDVVARPSETPPGAMGVHTPAGATSETGQTTASNVAHLNSHRIVMQGSALKTLQTDVDNISKTQQEFQAVYGASSLH
ncbi:unnamed protein product [Peniophora sp. CBMAI 1063]|nr:unnamed protein product [Peniophora sp. CBMAI 1063]